MARDLHLPRGRAPLSLASFILNKSLLDQYKLIVRLQLLCSLQEIYPQMIICMNYTACHALWSRRCAPPLLGPFQLQHIVT